MTTRETAAMALARFDHAWMALEATMKSLSDRELTEIRDPVGWSAKDHLMHVAIWEQALLARLDGGPRHEALGIDAAIDRAGDDDTINAAIFANTRQRPLRDVLDAVRGIHATTRARLVALADGTGDGQAAEGFLADVPSYADHYDQHHGWIRELSGRR
jgi:DinB superfamily